MKAHHSIFFLILIPCLAICQDVKEEAKDFFKTIVKAYFDRDCDKHYSFFSDSATVISPYGIDIYPTKEMIESRKTCDKFEEITSGLASFESYLKQYQIIVLNKKEFTSKNNETIVQKIAANGTSNSGVYEVLQEFNSNYTDCDYLVFGNIHKTNDKMNLANALFWMIVRKTKHGWIIFGTEP